MKRSSGNRKDLLNLRFEPNILLTLSDPSIGQIKAHVFFQSQEPRKYSPASGRTLKICNRDRGKLRFEPQLTVVSFSFFTSYPLILEQCLIHRRLFIKFLLNEWISEYLAKWTDTLLCEVFRYR